MLWLALAAGPLLAQAPAEESPEPVAASETAGIGLEGIATEAEETLAELAELQSDADTTDEVASIQETLDEFDREISEDLVRSSAVPLAGLSRAELADLRDRWDQAGDIHRETQDDLTDLAAALTEAKERLVELEGLWSETGASEEVLLGPPGPRQRVADVLSDIGSLDSEIAEHLEPILILQDLVSQRLLTVRGTWIASVPCRSSRSGRCLRSVARLSGR